MEIALGNGDYEMVTLEREGRRGILLRRHSTPHPVGEFTNTGGEKYWPEEHPEDCVIWLDKLESARILQDTVNLAVLNMQGIPRDR